MVASVVCSVLQMMCQYCKYDDVCIVVRALRTVHLSFAQTEQRVTYLACVLACNRHKLHVPRAMQGYIDGQGLTYTTA